MVIYKTGISVIFKFTSSDIFAVASLSAGHLITVSAHIIGISPAPAKGPIMEVSLSSLLSSHTLNCRFRFRWIDSLTLCSFFARPLQCSAVIAKAMVVLSVAIQFSKNDVGGGEGPPTLYIRNQLLKIQDNI